jgi:hypothetical protein
MDGPAERDLTVAIFSFPSFANEPKEGDNGSENIEMREMC